MGGDPEAVSGNADPESDLKSVLRGRSEEAVLNDAERSEGRAVEAFKKGREKLVELGTTATHVLALVDKQLNAVLQSHNKVKARHDAAKAA